MNFDGDTITGEGKRMKLNVEEQKMCHKFVLGKFPIEVENFTGKLPIGEKNYQFGLYHEGKEVKEEWLYGPVCNMKHQVIYPCSRFRCSIPCPCRICQPIEESTHSQEDRLKDHSDYHKTYHTNCDFSDNILGIFPNFNFWFLNKNIRVLTKKLGPVREHFKIKHPIVNTLPKPCQMMDEHTHPWDPVDLDVYPKNFNSSEKYLSWKKLWGTLGWIFCEECNYHVKTSKQYCEHILLNHTISKRFFHCYDYIKKDLTDVVPFKCFQCDEVFKGERDLSRHVLKVHYRVSFECHMCEEIFSFKDDRLRHLKTVHFKKNQIECSECGKKFSRINKLTEHINLGIDGNGKCKFACTECRKFVAQRIH